MKYAIRPNLNETKRFIFIGDINERVGFKIRRISHSINKLDENGNRKNVFIDEISPQTFNNPCPFYSKFIELYEGSEEDKKQSFKFRSKRSHTFIVREIDVNGRMSDCSLFDLTPGLFSLNHFSHGDIFEISRISHHGVMSKTIIDKVNHIENEAFFDGYIESAIEEQIKSFEVLSEKVDIISKSIRGTIGHRSGVDTCSN